MAPASLRNPPDGETTDAGVHGDAGSDEKIVVAAPNDDVGGAANEDVTSDGAKEASPDTLALASGPAFHVGERVLCTDRQRHPDKEGGKEGHEPPPLYEAVVRKSGLKHLDAATGDILLEKKKRGGRGGRLRPENSGPDANEGGGEGVKRWCHLIHFQGWNSRWDRWMTEKEVFHDTPENRTRVGIATKEAKSPAKTKEKDEKKVEKRGKKRKREKQSSAKIVEDDPESMYERNLQLIARACELPFTLQTKLVDDRDKICRRVYPPPSFNAPETTIPRGRTMLHVLPADVSIIGVLGEYVRTKKAEDLEEFAREQERQREEEEPQTAGDGDANVDEGKVVESANGSSREKQQPSDIVRMDKATLKWRKKSRKRFAQSVMALVDISLPLFLLYKEEREQYHKFMSTDGDADANGSRESGKLQEDGNAGGEEETVHPKSRRPSEVYGAEHLLRFFVKLPFILSQYNPQNDSAAANEESNMDAYILASEEKSEEFAEHIFDLIVFMQKRHMDCLQGRYFAVE